MLTCQTLCLKRPFLGTRPPLAHPTSARCHCPRVLQAVFKRGRAGLAAVSFPWSTDLVPEDPGFTAPGEAAAEPLAALGTPYCRHHPGSGSASLLRSGKLTSFNAAFARPPPHPELWVTTYSILQVGLPRCIQGNVETYLPVSSFSPRRCINRQSAHYQGVFPILITIVLISGSSLQLTIEQRGGYRRQTSCTAGNPGTRFLTSPKT